MSEEFFEQLRESERPVVVDVWAPWCGPCKMIEPILGQLKEEYAGRVDLWKVNADEQPDVSQALGVRGIPTLIVFQGDNEVTRRVGAMPPNQLRDLFETALTGEVPARAELPATDRALRLVAGIALLVLAWYANQNWLLILIAVLVLLSAVHDRLPSLRDLTAGSGEETPDEG